MTNEDSKFTVSDKIQALDDHIKRLERSTRVIYLSFYVKFNKVQFDIQLIPFLVQEHFKKMKNVTPTP